MRSVLQAGVLFLAPLLVSSAAISLNESIPSVYVFVDVPIGNTEIDSLCLPFHVEESDQICGPPALFFNDQPLTKDGDGVLTYGHGVTMTARWSFVCEKDTKSKDIAQRLDFRISAIDGEVLRDDVDFSMSFKQTGLVTISRAVGKDVRGTSRLDGNGQNVVEDGSSEDAEEVTETQDDEKPVDITEAEIQEEIMELEELRSEAVELSELIFAKEAALMDRLGQPLRPSTRPARLRDCESIGCVLRTLVSKFKQLIGISDSDSYPPVGQPFENGPGFYQPDGETPTIWSNQPGGQREKPMSSPASLGSNSQATVLSNQDGDGSFRTAPANIHRIPILEAAGFAAMFFGIFSFCGLQIAHRWHMRRNGQRPPRRRCGHHRRHETWAERRARRHARSQAIRGFFLQIFSRIRGIFGDVEKEAERRRAAVATETPPPPADTTMEQEIAGLRAAASMVDEMVAMEEGRRQVPPAAPTSYPGFVEMRNVEPAASPALPAYMEESLVADGFRYTPGSRDAPPTAPLNGTPLGTSSSDRLGYNK